MPSHYRDKQDKANKSIGTSKSQHKNAKKPFVKVGKPNFSNILNTGSTVDPKDPFGVRAAAAATKKAKKAGKSAATLAKARPSRKPGLPKSPAMPSSVNVKARTTPQSVALKITKTPDKPGADVPKAPRSKNPQGGTKKGQVSAVEKVLGLNRTSSQIKKDKKKTKQLKRKSNALGFVDK